MYHVWGRGEVHAGFWWGDLRKGDHVKDSGLDGGIILKWIFERLVGGVDWIDLDQDMDRLRSPVNTAMNRRVP
jgi:hypothetical protein